ncbi:cytochrome P450 [Nocardia sp. NBC_01388]|uniref:cytochrome P450 n=1 Tax=Nocardia sp. NBC_01388 TaxID=2903596 RepID=UPI00324534D1
MVASTSATAATAFGRPLSPSERWFWIIDRISPSNCTARVRVRGQLTAERIECAAAALTAEYPLLRVGVADAGSGDPRLLPLQDPRIPVRRLLSDDPLAWQCAIDAELISATFAGDGRTSGDDADEPFRILFEHVEELVNLAMGTMASTTLDPVAVDRARTLVGKLSSSVPAAYARADGSTTLGRCRELGLAQDHASGLAMLMAVAGTDTLASAMSRMVALLHDSGDQRALLAAPERTPDAVRETLRVTSPAYLVGRSVTADVEIAGRQLIAGEHVKILTWSINNAAGKFSIHRDYNPEARQLWFGGGRHLCLGAQLVHSELTALLGALTANGRPWEIVERRYRRNVFIPTYETLRIRLTD